MTADGFNGSNTRAAVCEKILSRQSSATTPEMNPMRSSDNSTAPDGSSRRVPFIFEIAGTLLARGPEDRRDWRSSDGMQSTGPTLRWFVPFVYRVRITLPAPETYFVVGEERDFDGFHFIVCAV